MHPVSRYKPSWPSFSFPSRLPPSPFHGPQPPAPTSPLRRRPRSKGLGSPLPPAQHCHLLPRTLQVSGERAGESHFVTGVNIWFSLFRISASLAKPAFIDLVSSPCPSSPELSSQVAVRPHHSLWLLSSPPPWTWPTGENLLLGSEQAEDLGPNGLDTAWFHTFFFFCNSKWLKQSIHFLYIRHGATNDTYASLKFFCTLLEEFPLWQWIKSYCSVLERVLFLA